MAQQLPVRLTDPKASPATQQIHADIYDKLNRLLTSAADTTTAATAASVTTVTNNVTATSISGATGTAAGPQYAFIPKLAAIPSNNPTTGAPYAQDGVLIEVNYRFLRYSLTDLAWQEAGTAVVILTDTHSNRVVSYAPATYTDALFLEQDTLLLLRSNGVTWITVAGQVSDTHANRLSTWPSVQFSVGTFFVETDRTARYWTQNASGTVTVTGGVNVAWVTGNHFTNSGGGFAAAQWPAGTVITINGAACTILTVNSATSITLAAATPNGVGVTYSVASGRWVYVDGRYTAVYGSLPTDLGENDYNTTTGFQFWDTTHFRLFQWAATGAAPASASPGWTRGQGELPTGSIQILPFGGGQMATGWQLCDGTGSISITRDDSTTTSITVPNLVGAYPKGGTTGTYSPSQNAATATVLNSLTPSGTVSVSVSEGLTVVQSGTGSSVGNGFPSGSGSFTGSPVTPTVLTEGEPANVVVPFYMKR